MDKFLGKKYVLVGTENFEDYLLHIGVGYLGRKAALALKPVQSLTLNEDGTYSFEFTSYLVSKTITFTPGEQFVEEKPDGNKVDALITIEDNRMIHTQIEDNGRTSTHVREFSEDSMIVTTTADGFDKIAIRRYELCV